MIGLKGHLMNPAFPEGYSEWRKVEPRELISAPLIKEPVQKNVHKALRKQAKDADSVVIATDYDREGELIGLEALEEILDANPKLAENVSLATGVKRARYSALTKEEIDEAFTNLVELSEPLARAGEARQDIDLIWGATLTRFVSLATGRLGSQFLSVGRVQSPTLAIVVERELERRAHVPKPYWEVFAAFEHPDGAVRRAPQGGQVLGGGRGQGRARQHQSPGVVKSVESKRNTRKPPAPFNTTAFTSAASSVGVSPARAMRIAEDLYMDGFISYPRTDNTVYPKSLPVRELLHSIAQVPAFKEAQPLAERPELTPTRGKKETTDHPPIYPTQALDPNVLPDDGHRKIYELVVRRFLATFADPSVSESTRADIEAGTETYFVRGNVLVEPGFLAVYPYGRSKDEEIPKVEEGQELALAGGRGARPRRTSRVQPVGRRQGDAAALAHRPGQADRDDGGARAGHEGHAPRHHPEAVRPRLRAGQPDRAARDRRRDGVRLPTLRRAGGDTRHDRRARGRHGQDRVRPGHQGRGARDLAQDAARVIRRDGRAQARARRDHLEGDGPGPHPRPLPQVPRAGRANEQGETNHLRIIRAKKSGKRFVGCEGYPDCDQTYGLPQRGDIIKLEDVCSICGVTPRVRVMGGRRPWNLCLNEECPSMAEMRAQRAEREAARAAKEAAEAEAGGGDGAAEPEEKKKTPAKAGAKNGAGTRRRKAPAGT